MDISKLPRLSKTDAPPPADPAAPDQGTGQDVKRTGFDVVMASEATPGTTPVAAVATSFCRQCGAPLRPNARFCDSCGAATGPSTGAGRLDYDRSPEPGVGAEAWISIAIGLLLLLMQPRLVKFLSHKLFGTYFAPYVNNETGVEVAYTAQMDFWSDLGITMFAVVLVAEGIVLAFARRRGLVMIAFVLTVLTTAYNLGYLLYTVSSGIAILSAMAVAFGVYIAIYEWKLLQQSRRVAR